MQAQRPTADNHAKSPMTYRRVLTFCPAGTNSGTGNPAFVVNSSTHTPPR